jgi:hypothetical protein
MTAPKTEQTNRRICLTEYSFHFILATSTPFAVKRQPRLQSVERRSFHPIGRLTRFFATATENQPIVDYMSTAADGVEHTFHSSRPRPMVAHSKIDRVVNGQTQI